MAVNVEIRLLNSTDFGVFDRVVDESTLDPELVLLGELDLLSAQCHGDRSRDVLARRVAVGVLHHALVGRRRVDPASLHLHRVDVGQVAARVHHEHAEPEREHDLHQQRLPVHVSRARQRRAEVLDVAEHRG